MAEARLFPVAIAQNSSPIRRSAVVLWSEFVLVVLCVVPAATVTLVTVPSGGSTQAEAWSASRVEINFTHLVGKSQHQKKNVWEFV